MRLKENFFDSEGMVILETELTNENKEVEIPDFLTVKKDITDDYDYRNVNLYRKINNRRKNGPVVKKKDNK